QSHCPHRRGGDGRIKAWLCRGGQILQIIKPILEDEIKLRLIVGSQVDYVSPVLRDQNVGQRPNTSFTDVPKFVKRGKYHIARLDFSCISARHRVKRKAVPARGFLRILPECLPVSL